MSYSHHFVNHFLRFIIFSIAPLARFSLLLFLHPTKILLILASFNKRVALLIVNKPEFILLIVATLGACRTSSLLCSGCSYLYSSAGCIRDSATPCFLLVFQLLATESHIVIYADAYLDLFILPFGPLLSFIIVIAVFRPRYLHFIASREKLTRFN